MFVSQLHIDTKSDWKSSTSDKDNRIMCTFDEDGENESYLSLSSLESLGWLKLFELIAIWAKYDQSRCLSMVCLHQIYDSLAYLWHSTQ